MRVRARVWAAACHCDDEEHAEDIRGGVALHLEREGTYVAAPCKLAEARRVGPHTRYRLLHRI